MGLELRTCNEKIVQRLKNDKQDRNIEPHGSKIIIMPKK